MPYGWAPYPQSPTDTGDYTTTDYGGHLNVIGEAPPPVGFRPPNFGGHGGGGNTPGEGGGGRGGFGGDPGPYGVAPPMVPPQPIPTQPSEITDIKDGRTKFQKWLDDMKEALKNFKFDMGGVGISQLLQWFLKGATIAEIIDELGKGDDKKPDAGGPGGGKGGKGGGGGGKGGGYAGPGGVGAYQGLNYKPSFLSWQPTNAGAPMFSAGGPSSLSGSPPPPPPPPVKPKKNKKG